MMEMSIPLMSSPLQSTAPSHAGGTKSGETFQLALTHHIATNDTAAKGQPAPNGIVAASVVPAASEASGMLDQTPALEELMALIDNLLDALDLSGEDDQSERPEQLDGLNAMLDQMYALLALLGAPIAATQQADRGAQATNDGRQLPEQALLNAKSSLQDTLLQLQTILQQGPLKRVQGQEPLALIERQLHAMAKSLSNETAGQAISAAKPPVELPEWIKAQPNAPADNAAHLQRITRQTAHPLFAASSQAAAATAAGSVQPELPQPAADAALATQSVFVGPDNIRDFAPLLTRTSAAPSAFVLADQFADTMNGLIVQKFSVTSLNGISEARLMLFPEQLGGVDVKITMQNGLLTAVFQADTARAKDMLENQMAQLRAALQAQGLNVEKLEVTQAEPSIQMSGQHPGQGNNGQQSSGNGSQSESDEHVNDTAFGLELEEQAAIQGLGFGRTINETA